MRPKNTMNQPFLAAVAFAAMAALLPCHVALAQCEADLNGNNTVDNDDLLLLLMNYGATCEEVGWADPVISEIHYNPSSLQGNDSQFEFVELMNPHAFAIDLSGWSIADGIDVSFPEGTYLPAGGFLLTANDTSTYRALLGPFVPMLEWSGTSNLHNSGETLRVLRPDGSEGDVVTYSDTNGWTNEADGLGGSLEWKGPGWDNSLPDAWIGSNALGGSPGADNSSWAD